MKYVPEFDGLRAFAAIIVVANHAHLSGFHGGLLGVDVFFVLSGYLTTRLAFQSRGGGDGIGEVANYISRRLWRLWPLMLTVGGTVAAAYVLLGKGATATGVIPAVFFAQNIAPHAGAAFGHFWTLANEMQFYLLIAFIVILLPSVRLVQVILLLGFVATTATRSYFTLEGEWMAGCYTPFARSSGLFLGAVLATLPASAQSGRKTVPVLVGGLSLMLLGMSMAVKHEDAMLLTWITVVEVGTAGVIWAVVSGARLSADQWARLPLEVIRRLGILSFGLYLWHYPIIVALRGHTSPEAMFVLALIGGLILAALSYRFVETPLRRGVSRRQAA